MSNLPRPGRRVRLLNVKGAVGSVRRKLPIINHGPKKGEVAPDLAILNGDTGTKWYITPGNWEYET